MMLDPGDYRSWWETTILRWLLTPYLLFCCIYCTHNLSHLFTEIWLILSSNKYEISPCASIIIILCKYKSRFHEGIVCIWLFPLPHLHACPTSSVVAAHRRHSMKTWWMSKWINMPLHGTLKALETWALFDMQLPKLRVTVGKCFESEGERIVPHSFSLGTSSPLLQVIKCSSTIWVHDRAEVMLSLSVFGTWLLTSRPCCLQVKLAGFRICDGNSVSQPLRERCSDVS